MINKTKKQNTYQQLETCCVSSLCWLSPALLSRCHLTRQATTRGLADVLVVLVLLMVSVAVVGAVKVLTIVAKTKISIKKKKKRNQELTVDRGTVAIAAIAVSTH